MDGLKHNLLSISQLCDIGLKINFNKDACIIEEETLHEIKLIGKRVDNILMIPMDDLSLKIKCIEGNNNNDAWLWHKIISHIHMDRLNKLVKDKLCDTCKKGKKIKISFKAKNIVSTSRPLQLIHMDLFGPSTAKSFCDKYYALVIVYAFQDLLGHFF